MVRIMVSKITTDEFKEMIKDDSQPMVVDCYADWCMPCKMSSPAFEKMSQNYVGKAKFVKVNVDEEPAVAQAFGVRGVPSFFVLLGKKVVAQVVGADLKKLETQLQSVIEKQTEAVAS